MQHLNINVLYYILVTYGGSMVSANAADIRVAFGLSLPPYVISANDSGMEYDIIKEALAYKSHTITPVYMPFIEVSDAIVEGRADAIATITETVGIEGYFSNIMIRYHNFIISRKDRGVEIENIQDLADKKVVAFQMATSYLGNAFAEMAKKNPFYRERTEQEKQVSLLLDGKVDVAVADKNIFQYFKNKMTGRYGHIDIVYHNIFEPNDYKIVLREETQRDDFNEGLQALKDSGRYDAIIASYIGEPE